MYDDDDDTDDDTDDDDREDDDDDQPAAKIAYNIHSVGQLVKTFQMGSLRGTTGGATWY